MIESVHLRINKSISDVNLFMPDAMDIFENIFIAIFIATNIVDDKIEEEVAQIIIGEL